MPPAGKAETANLFISFEYNFENSLSDNGIFTFPFYTPTKSYPFVIFSNSKPISSTGS